MFAKPITAYPENTVKLQNVNNVCTAYVNLASCGDIVVDGLKKTEHRGFTHEYIQKFNIDFFRMRLRDGEFETLRDQGILIIKCRSYFFEHNQALVPHKIGGDAIFPAFLFNVELDKKYSFKSKTFRAVVAKQYLAAECYSQIKGIGKNAKGVANGVPTKKVQPQTPVITGVTMDDFSNMIIKLRNAGYADKIVFDGNCMIAIPMENSLGN